MIDSPCRACTDRPVGGGCHSSCPKYAEYRKKIDERNRKREEAREANRHGKAITPDVIRQIYRKAGGHSVNIQSR